MSDLTEATIQVAYLEILNRLPTRSITCKLSGASNATSQTELVLVKSYWGSGFEVLFVCLTGVASASTKYGSSSGYSTANNLDAARLKEVLGLPEYKQNFETGDITFNDTATNLTMTTTNISSTNYTGLVFGNGKVGFQTTSSGYKIGSTYISGVFDKKKMGVQKSRKINGFNFGEFALEGLTGYTSNNDYTQVCDLHKCTHKITETQNHSSNPNIAVNYEIMPLRQMPHAVLTIITLTATGNISNLKFSHKITEPSNKDITDTKFETEVVDTNSKKLRMTTARGKLKDSDNDLVMCSLYMFGTAPSNDLGLPESYQTTADTPIGQHKDIFTVDLTSETPFKIGILTSMVSDKDFERPLIEAKRLTLGGALNQVGSTDPIATLKADHESRWATLWASNLRMSSKTGLTDNDTAIFNKLQRLMFMSQFQFFCNVNDVFFNGVSRSGLTSGGSGNIFYDNDLWIMPILLFLNPDAAKNILEFRYDTLKAARKNAGQSGLNGARYPFETDVGGEEESSLYLVNTKNYIFQTGLVAISIWNYYRATFDKTWFKGKGYEIMKEIAEFFTNFATINGSTVDFKNIRGFEETTVNNDLLTDVIIGLTMKYTIEASYEMGHTPNDKWTTIKNNVKLEKSGSRYLPHTGYTSGSLTSTGVFYPVFPLLFEGYSSHANGAINFLTEASVEAMTEYYVGAKDSVNLDTPAKVSSSSPMNKVILSAVYNLLSNYEQNSANKAIYSNNSQTLLLNLLRENQKGPWGILTDSSGTFTNIVEMYSSVLLLFLQSYLQLRIKGSVAATNFYSQEFAIRLPIAENVSEAGLSMPKIIKDISVSNIGTKKKTFTVTNVLSYP